MESEADDIPAATEKDLHQEHEKSPSEASDEAGESDEDSDDWGNRTPPNSPGRFASASRVSYGGHHLDFIDDVSEGISSYLDFLEARSNDASAAYNRYAGQETVRWQESLQRIVMESHQTHHEKTVDNNEESEPLKLSRPVSGRPSSPCLGPCTPPKELQFETFGRRAGFLSFSSSFECGNLALAQRESATEYSLVVDNDVNTSGYKQWFYFAVRGGIKGTEVRFRLVNMSKSGSLFERGMKPVIWSELSGRGWERGGTEVQYYATDESQKRKKNARFTLSFKYLFEHDEDTVFFAYHYPYTYTYLQSFLDALSAHPYAGKLFNRKVLCTTIGGLPCPLLELGEVEERSDSRKLAVMTARIHPGESNSSWMMHGFLEFLLSPADEAKFLRNKFRWVIVPMMNPDGVVHGCYRCGLAGCDLNRVYMSPHKNLHPTVWHLKDMIKSQSIEIFIDLHGHSKKDGVFFYGGKVSYDDERNANIQLIPRLCCLASDDFKWSRCSFNTNESKLTAARLVSFLQLNADRSYTVEASFYSNIRVLKSNTERSLQAQTAPGELEEPDVHESEEPILTSVAQQEPADDKDAMPEEATEAWREKVAREITTLPWLRSTTHRKGTMEPLDFAHLDLSAEVLALQKERQEMDEWSDDELESDNDEKYYTPYSGRRASSDRRALERRQSVEDEQFEQPNQMLAKREMTMSDGNKELSEDEAFDQADLHGEMPVGHVVDFNPSRLELIGPIIGRALCTATQLESEVKTPSSQSRPADDAEALLDGSEARDWPHLHYGRLNVQSAQWELAKLIRGRISSQKDGDDAGSDSNPSADEKPGAELLRIHKRLLRKLNKLRDKKPKKEPPPPPLPPPAPAPEVSEETPYRIVVAFGKATKVPIKPGDKDKLPEASPRASLAKPSDMPKRLEADRPSALEAPRRQSLGRLSPSESPLELNRPWHSARQGTRGSATAGETVGKQDVRTDESAPSRATETVVGIHPALDGGPKNAIEPVKDKEEVGKRPKSAVLKQVSPLPMRSDEKDDQEFLEPKKDLLEIPPCSEKHEFVVPTRPRSPVVPRALELTLSEPPMKPRLMQEEQGAKAWLGTKKDEPLPQARSYARNDVRTFLSASSIQQSKGQEQQAMSAEVSRKGQEATTSRQGMTSDEKVPLAEMEKPRLGTVDTQVRKEPARVALQFGSRAAGLLVLPSASSGVRDSQQRTHMTERSHASHQLQPNSQPLLSEPPRAMPMQSPAVRPLHSPPQISTQPRPLPDKHLQKGEDAVLRPHSRLDDATQSLAARAAAAGFVSNAARMPWQVTEETQRTSEVHQAREARSFRLEAPRPGTPRRVAPHMVSGADTLQIQTARADGRGSRAEASSRARPQHWALLALEQRVPRG